AGVTRWTQAQADSAFENDIKKYEKAVNDYFTRSFNQNQFDAMASFTYNLGAGIFAQDGWEKNASNSYITASFPNYINKGSAFEEGLKKRRQAEVNLFNTPVSGGSETNKGEEEMFIIETEKNNYFITDGKFTWISNPGTLNNLKQGLKCPVIKMKDDEMRSMFNKLKG
uniref:lysozyme n=1 Tax=Lactococcus garvieae TaxID=1363 RepID=UPI002550887B